MLPTATALAARLAAMLPAYGGAVDADAKQRLAGWLERIAAWNDRIRLVGDASIDLLVARHTGESLYLRRLLPELATGGIESLVDVGSGAGFPGLALALVLPQLKTTLVESVGKKAVFLNTVVEELGVSEQIRVRTCRMEELKAGGFAAPDLFTCRALDRMETLPRRLAPLLGAGTRVALWVNAAMAENWLKQFPDWAWSEPALLPETRDRYIVVAHGPKS